MNKKYLNRNTAEDLFILARQNRKASTEAEEKLWQNLRNRKLKGFKFRRQQRMGHYILDFFCLEANLAIEVDGGYHDLGKQKLYDEDRTLELNALHITVIRFTNEEVMNSIESVLNAITVRITQNA